MRAWFFSSLGIAFALSLATVSTAHGGDRRLGTFLHGAAPNDIPVHYRIRGNRLTMSWYGEVKTHWKVISDVTHPSGKREIEVAMPNARRLILVDGPSLTMTTLPRAGEAPRAPIVSQRKPRAGSRKNWQPEAAKAAILKAVATGDYTALEGMPFAAVR